MFNQKINYDNDLPSRNINLFKNHRFLILLRNTGAATSPANELTEDGQHYKNITLETVDVQKAMGELLPSKVARILAKHRQSDCMEWFSRKAYSKPIHVIEKHAAVLERKEQIAREQLNQQTEAKAPGSAKLDGAGIGFAKAHTLESSALDAAGGQIASNFSSKKREKHGGGSASPTKKQLHRG